MAKGFLCKNDSKIGLKSKSNINAPDQGKGLSGLSIYF